ncbi:nifR3 family TIM-barrel protein [Planoprotostelium fungivorum]|uniref:tRNA-dihydrouridine synthase n=1 Tax=Planoprotostelium fungivorum TaxID=1890364 RepID=A0A2P6NBZ7_9EUKA|nr:nifR3 family TIM-barrel protein [Planoprotostelium fungivorum]
MASRFQLMAAPLEGYSDRAFRKLCHNHGASKTFTEMARVEALSKNNKSTWSRVITVQLLPTTTDHLKKFLDMWHAKGYQTSEWNLNLGCPSPNLVSKGLGVAMMKRINKINQHIDILKETGVLLRCNLIPDSYQLPVSIKIRLGMNEMEASQRCYLNTIKNTNADYYIVHARNGKQKSSDKPDWSVYRDCVVDGKIVIANGDIRTTADLDFLRISGISGVMMGRVAVQNPTIFSQFVNHMENPSQPASHAKTTEERQKVVEEVKREYDRLLSTYYASEEEAQREKYRSNFMRHFANPKYEDMMRMSRMYRRLTSKLNDIECTGEP